jgi:pyrimidine operon attenuation protein/uracil phosphoribosyltransferase
MIESSTIIPRTTIRAARDTVLRSIPVRNITATATAVHTGTPELAINADLIGKSISMTSITTSIDITRSLRKEITEDFTTHG